MTLREMLIGPPEKYNYLRLCTPTYPGAPGKPSLNFYGKDEPLPLFMALLMGLQHAFAMVGGLITPPYVVFRFTISFVRTDLQQYAIAAALITSGICTIINVSKLPIPFTAPIFGRQLYLGSGLLSVMGTSFTFLPIFELSIKQMMNDGEEGTTAYGRMLGTAAVCAILEVVLSSFPKKVLHAFFPPLITAVTVMLIGVALVGTGMKYWGGGVVCAEMIWKEHDQAVDKDIFFLPSPICQNGDVRLGYGSFEFIVLGFCVMLFLVVIELFGSTFMKNCNVVLALLFGYLVSGIWKVDGNSFVDSSKIEDADWFTFLWMETFPLGFYGPAVIPLLIAFMVTTVETVGDISAVYEASDLEINTPEYDESLQGGLLSDAVSSILGALFTSMPNTTFSQNNGVISLTKCAARRAGYAAGFWLILMGVFSKIAGLITSIPDAVLGGMTIFLFSNVFVSGVTIASTLDLHSRRVRFILALSMAVGIGVTVWPFAFQDMRASSYSANFWRCEDCSTTMKGFRNGVTIFLSTGYCIGTVVAMLLNFILPADTAVVKFGKKELEEVGDEEIEVAEGEAGKVLAEDEEVPEKPAVVKDEE